MKSKTSLFKASLIRKNISRFWPVALVYLIILFFVLPFTATVEMTSHGISDVRLINVMAIAQDPILTAVAAFAAALLIFSYLFSSRSCNMMHAFPLDRNQLFASNYISGLLLILVPQVIVLILTLPAVISAGLANMILPWLLYSFGTAFVFYTIAVFCCILAGHAFGAILFFAFFNFAEGLVVMLFRFFMREYSYGMGEADSLGAGRQYILSPLMYISNECRLDYSVSYTEGAQQSVLDIVWYNGAFALGMYCVAAAVLLAVTILFYRRRALETAGEISSFAFMRPAIRWSLAFGVGTVMGFFITVGSAYSFRVFILAFVIFSLLAFLFSEMILRKSFRVFRKAFLIEAIICTAIFAGIFLFLKNDPAHLINRIPSAKKIEAAAVVGTYSIVRTDPEGIEQIRALQKTILDHRSEYERYEKAYHRGDTGMMNMSNIRFIYADSSGETIVRSYAIPSDKTTMADPASAVAQLNELENDPQGLVDYVFGLNPDVITWEKGSFCEEALSAEETAAVYEAFKKDILEGNVTYHTGSDEIYSAFQYYFPINLEGTAEPELKTLQELVSSERGVLWWGSYGINPVWIGYYDPESSQHVESSFYLAKTCTHTIDALVDAGVITGIDELEKIIKQDSDEGIQLR